MDLPLRRRAVSPDSLEMPYKYCQENIPYWGWKETEIGAKLLSVYLLILF